MAVGALSALRGGMADGSVKLEDIARLANVSVATVSRALNDSPLVKPDTKRLIWKLAREHRYPFRPSMPTAPLGSSATIAIVITRPQGRTERMSDPFLMQLIAGIGDAAREQDCDFTISHVAPRNFDDLSSIMETSRSDGVIFIGQGDLFAQFNRLADTHAGRFVVWGARFEDQHYCSVGSDNLRGGHRATAHLLRLGRRRPIFLGDTEAPEVAQRLAGYRRAMEEAGAPVDPGLIVPAHFDIEFSEAAVDTLLARRFDFDGVVAASDMIALGAIRALTRGGLRVPQDISVVGYDDVQFARYSHPALSTVAQDTGRAGRLMVSKLLQQGGGRPRSERIPTDLIVRESCGG